MYFMQKTHQKHYIRHALIGRLSIHKEKCYLHSLLIICFHRLNPIDFNILLNQMALCTQYVISLIEAYVCAYKPFNRRRM